MDANSPQQAESSRKPLLLCSMCGLPEHSAAHTDHYAFDYHEFVDPRTPSLDLVNHPPHYTQHPSGVECIQITEHMNFCLGNAVKYIWRAASKNGIEDLEKAKWYLEREIARISNR